MTTKSAPAWACSASVVKVRSRSSSARNREMSSSWIGLSPRRSRSTRSASRSSRRRRGGGRGGRPWRGRRSRGRRSRSESRRGLCRTPDGAGRRAAPLTARTAADEGSTGGIEAYGRPASRGRGGGPPRGLVLVPSVRALGPGVLPMLGIVAVFFWLRGRSATAPPTPGPLARSGPGATTDLPPDVVPELGRLAAELAVRAAGATRRWPARWRRSTPRCPRTCENSWRPVPEGSVPERGHRGGTAR